MLPKSAENKIREIVHEVCPEAFILEIALHKSKRHIMKVILDTDEGVKLTDCAEISRKVGHYLEEEAVINVPYTLEVTSPGVDRPLELERQYRKNIGRDLKVLTTEHQTIKGKLLSVEDKGITLEPELQKKKSKKGGPKRYGEPKNIPFEEIKEAKVLVSFR